MKKTDYSEHDFYVKNIIEIMFNKKENPKTRLSAIKDFSTLLSESEYIPSIRKALNLIKKGQYNISIFNTDRCRLRFEMHIGDFGFSSEICFEYYDKGVKDYTVYDHFLLTHFFANVNNFLLGLKYFIYDLEIFIKNKQL